MVRVDRPRGRAPGRFVARAHTTDPTGGCYLPGVLAADTLDDLRWPDRWREHAELNCLAERYPPEHLAPMPKRRVIVPPKQRPGYVAPVANAATLKRRAQKERATDPEAQTALRGSRIMREVGL